MNASTIKNNYNSGSILLEAFISIIVISIAFGVLFSVAALTIKTSTSIQQNDQANFLLKEAMESARNFRDGTTWATNGLGIANTSSNNPYYFLLDTSVTPNKWTLTAGTETVGMFTRKIVFDKVSRDPSTQNIESIYNASHDDPNTRKITATVSWNTKTLNLVTYLTNWK
jgi:hypothetical protein